jgi:acyl dehydratase
MSETVNSIGSEISRGPIQGTSAVGGSDLGTNNRPAVPNVFHFAQMTELLVGHFQQNWFTSGQLSIRYLKPLQQGEELVVKAKVVSYDEDNADRVNLSIWCENINGELLATGDASCIWTT